MALGKSACFVVPAYNEEESLGVVLVELKKLGVMNGQVIVVNDGSVDDTAKVAKKNKVILVTNKGNCGVGYSIQQGLKNV